MISRKLVWTTTLVVAVAGLAGGALIADGLLHREVVTIDAAWKQVFTRPADLVRGADAIVFAKAVAVAPGRVAYSDNGEDALPFQVVEFEVVRGLKGAEGMDRVYVERAGGVDPEGRSVFLDMDGGPFELGQTYMLFLKTQEEGPYFYQVNDQGRYRVAQDRLIAAAPDDPVATRFHNRTVEEGAALVRSHLRAGAPQAN